jgi:hypothetical protein
MALLAAFALVASVGVPADTGEGDAAPSGKQVIHYRGEGDLQAVLDRAPPHATVVCELEHPLEITKTLHIARPLTLKGLKATLPKDLRATPILVVDAPHVRITEADLRGNYKTIGSGRGRVPLIHIRNGPFQVDACTFRGASKDGVMITPAADGGDIVGGVVRDIEAFGIGRDAVSIAGGNRGQRVVNVAVENVRLSMGHKRGAVEVSDGTDNITVRNVYAEKAVYAIDIQDHGRGSAPNRNIVIEKVEAVNCKHVVRMANSARGHANLVLRDLVARRCQLPVELSHTRNVVLDGVRVLEGSGVKPAIQISNCHGVLCRNLTIEGLDNAAQAIKTNKVTQLEVETPAAEE